MDKISKALKSFSEKEKETVKILLGKILEKDVLNLDIKKLKGQKDIFRIRKGGIRIIYRINDDNEIYVLAIERKSEKTYKFL